MLNVSSADRFVLKITQLIHSDLNLEVVYKAVVDEVGQYLHADRCFISRINPETGDLCAPTLEYRSTEQVKSIIDEAPAILWEGLSDYVGELCQESQPVDYQDLHHNLAADTKELLVQLQVHSGIAVAIHFQKCLGILFVQSMSRERVWSSEDKNVLHLISHQVAAVTHHSDLYQHLGKLSEHRQVLNQLYQRAIKGVEPQVLFELVLAQIEDSLGISTSKIVQFLPNQNPTQPLRIVACRGLPSQLVGQYLDVGQEPHAAFTLESKKPIVVTNIYQEKRFGPSPLHLEYGLISGIAVVIWGAQQPFGVLEVDERQERCFSIEDIQFTEALANLLGTVLERKQVEELAYKSEQKFKLMVQGLQDYAVAWLSPEGVIESWNSAAERIFGYSAEQVLGQSCKILYVDEDILNEVPQQLLRAAARQCQVTQEGPKRCRAGNIIYCEVTLTALYDPNNHLLGYVTFARDISVRKEAELALRASEEKFRSLVEGSKDYAIYMVNTYGQITSWNPGAENIYGYSSTEILGSHFSKFLTEEDIQAGLVEQEISVATQIGRFETEGWRIRKDGKRFWALIVLNALYDEAHKVMGFTNVTRDITERQLANEALRESQERFDRVVSGSDEGFWDWDVVQDKIYWSNRLYEMLGIKSKNAPESYASYESMLHEEDKERVGLIMEETIKQGTPFQAEFRMRHSSGEYRYFYSRAKPYYDQQNQLKLISGMLADVTERKTTEMALLSTQQLLVASLSAAQTGTFRWNFKESLIQFDSNMKALFGLLRDEATITLKDFKSLIYFEDQEAVSRALEESEFQGKDFDLEYRVMWPDGSVHWIYGKGKTFFDPEGGPDYMTGAGLETTDKKLAEEQILASYRALQDVTNALNVSTIVAITDPKGRITEVNEAFCRISKYNRSELMGQDHRILNSGYHSREFFQNLWATIAQGQVWKGEIRNRAKDGSIYWVDTTIVPYLNDQGMPKQYVAIRHDVTLQKNAEARLLESNRDLEQFASIASHDLQAPLRKVKMFGHMLAEQWKSKESQDELGLVQRMNRSIDTMQQLIQDLLELSQLSLEPPDFEQVDLSMILNHVLLNLEDKIQETQAEIIVGHLEPIYGDPAQLTQLLQNLIENGLKYQVPTNRPKIIIQSDCEAKKNCAIRVQDNGIGISTANIARIFKPFERLHGKSSIYSGTGIGLAICKRIVERHQGNIRVESKLGQGTVFIVELPKISLKENSLEGKGKIVLPS